MLPSFTVRHDEKSFLHPVFHHSNPPESSEVYQDRILSNTADSPISHQSIRGKRASWRAAVDPSIVSLHAPYPALGRFGNGNAHILGGSVHCVPLLDTPDSNVCNTHICHIGTDGHQTSD